MISPSMYSHQLGTHGLFLHEAHKHTAVRVEDKVTQVPLDKIQTPKVEVEHFTFSQ